MASLTARDLFLLQNNALQFDLSGVKRRRKHDVFKSGYQFGEFNHLYNELREGFTKFIVTVVCCLQYLIKQCGLYDSIFPTAQRIFQKKISGEERKFVPLRYIQYASNLTYFIHFHYGGSLVNTKTAALTLL